MSGPDRPLVARVEFGGCVCELLGPTPAERAAERSSARTRTPAPIERDPLSRPEPAPLPTKLASRQRPLF